MNAREFVVRIVKPSSDPVQPRLNYKLHPVRQVKKNSFFSKALNILAGSVIGMLSGLAIYLALKLVGINFGGLESSLIIGLPSAFGVIASLAVF